MWVIKRAFDGKYFSGFDYNDSVNSFNKLIKSKFATFDLRRALFFHDESEVCDTSKELYKMGHDTCYIYEMNEIYC